MTDTAIAKAIASRGQSIRATRINSERPATPSHDFDHYADRPDDGFDWLRGASCAGADTEDFFPGGGRGSTSAAKAFCSTCPVMEECLRYAMERPWLAGVWGGLSAYQRRDLRRAERQGSAA